MTFAADGKTVFSMDSDEVRTWDAGTGKEIRRLALPRGTLTRSLHPVALSPDGKRLAEGRYTQGLRLIDAENGKELQWFRKIGYRVDNRCVLSFSPGGKTLAVFDPLGPGSVYLVEAATAKLAHTLKLPGERTGKAKGTLDGHLGEVLVVAFSPDGKRLASGGKDTTALVWDLAPFRERPKEK